jgi:hypothetical protein
MPFWVMGKVIPVATALDTVIPWLMAKAYILFCLKDNFLTTAVIS